MEKDTPLSEKQAFVNRVFHAAAKRYDLMNDLMSFGIHRLWKAHMVAQASLPSQYAAGAPFRALDVAGGTGDIALRIAKKTPDNTRIVVCDINTDMLEAGRHRCQAPFSQKIDFMQADACALPFPDGSYDLYTIAFGIRNVPTLETALSESQRVLRRGGHFMCLEFSMPVIPFLDKMYDLYSFKVIPVLGEAVVGDRAAYQYLVDSIRRFPPRERFMHFLRQAGFSQLSCTPLSGGIVAVYSGWKL